MTKPIITNLDKKLTPEESAKEEKIRDVADAIEEGERKTDGYQYLGDINPNSDHNIVTEAHLKHTAKDFRQKRADGDKIIPLGRIVGDNEEWVWLLNDTDAEAVELGYACENCLEFQAFPNLPICEWELGGSCGYTKFTG